MPAASRKSALDFNKQIVLGEIGALVLANLTALVVSRFTSNAAVISGSAVAGTLIGGTVVWIPIRIADQKAEQRFSWKGMAGDLGFFTPAALTFAFVLYEPCLYFMAHFLLSHGSPVEGAVIPAQVIAFCLFLAGMNLYREFLHRTGRRCL